MTTEQLRPPPPPPLTGRVAAGPAGLLRAEILDPQFAHEAGELLEHYVAIERALTAEYVRMGLMTPDQAAAVAYRLGTVTVESITSLRQETMSDVAFAVERQVERGLPGPIPMWHVDRSRNDYQACAQLMYGRRRLADVAAVLLDFARAAHLAASTRTAQVMPGYTHLQAAQVISPGFYLAAVVEHALHCAERMLSTYDQIDACPLGAGAISGQELPWDRRRLAGLLGFGRVQQLALTAVADRGWVVEVTAELEILAVGLSRHVTDLMAWASTAYGFLELPDELAGISSAMPQKKNYPVLERVRGRLAHLSSLHLDAVLAQRNTAYSNSVEVSKEGAQLLPQAFEAAESALRLFTAVLAGARFDERRMEEACEREFLGGFALANRLTLTQGVPWRRAQVVAGRYIVALMEDGGRPSDSRPDVLRRVAAECGAELTDPEAALAGTFSVRDALFAPASTGSVHPRAVGDVLRAQDDRIRALAEAWEARVRTARAGEGAAHATA